METAELRTEEFWAGGNSRPVLLKNPRKGAGLKPFTEHLHKFPEIDGHFVVETSGSGGIPKYVCLSRSAMMSSARAVNDHLQVESSDRWLCALPTFHVGGLAIYARAAAAGIEVVDFVGAWSSSEFHRCLKTQRITLTSLVPTQVSDLVHEKYRAPSSLRAVVVGGGHLPESVERAARDLGWPLLSSYGMTEAASQIATQSLKELGSAARGTDHGLTILPHWEVRVIDKQRIQIRGDSLFTCYLQWQENRVTEDRLVCEPSKGQDGWFTTNDRGLVDQGMFRFLGRSDRSVKILGELVDVDEVERQLRSLFDAADREAVFVEAFEDARRGARLVPIMVRDQIDAERMATALAGQRRDAVPFERLSDPLWVNQVPLSALGKIRREELRRLARSV